MNTQIETVKGEFERTVGRLLKNLAETPEDKLHWSPSPTSRTPLEIGYHCADVIAALHGSMSGLDPMPPTNPAQMDAYCREQEKPQRSREEVVKLIQDNSAAYAAWLEGIPEGKLAEIWNSPFGDFPIGAAISFPVFHTAGHVAQLEYIQTIYGDRIWH